MRRLASVLVAAAVLGTVASSGLAAGGTTLLATPSTVQLGSSFTLSGDGYPAPTSLSFEVTGPRKSGIHYFTAGEPLATSSFSETWTAWWGVTGDYQITSYYRDSKGATHKAAVVKITVTD